MDNKYQTRWKRFIIGQIITSFLMSACLFAVMAKMAVMGLWGALFIGIPLFGFSLYMGFDWLRVLWRER